MKDSETIERYLKFFGRRLSERLKPGIAFDCNVYPASGSGAVLEFLLRPGSSNKVEFRPVEETVNSVLEHIPQKLVGGNISGIQFSGTNISLEGNRILLIKGEDSEQSWDSIAAKNDIKRIFHTHPENKDE